MNIYSINVLNGRETVGRNVVLHSIDVKPTINAEELKEQFIIVDKYYRRDLKKVLLREEEPAHLTRSVLYLRGEEILRKPNHITLDDIEAVKEELTCVFLEDGTRYYIPPIPLSTTDVIGIVGTECFTMHIVKDEPQRWATFSFDPKQYGLKTKPVLNKVASDMFGEELYGNVIYVNENLVS